MCKNCLYCYHVAFSIYECLLNDGYVSLSNGCSCFVDKNKFFKENYNGKSN